VYYVLVDICGVGIVNKKDIGLQLVTNRNGGLMFIQKTSKNLYLKVSMKQKQLNGF